MLSLLLQAVIRKNVVCYVADAVEEILGKDLISLYNNIKRIPVLTVMTRMGILLLIFFFEGWRLLLSLPDTHYLATDGYYIQNRNYQEESKT